VNRRRRRPDRLFDAVADGRSLPQGRVEDPDDVEAFRAAIELRAGVPAADLPSEAFVAGLRARLASEAAGPVPRPMSRRSLLATAGAVAAGAVAAGAAGVAIDRAILTPPDVGGSRAASVLDPAEGEWTAVTTEAAVSGGATQRFDAGGVIGFVTGTDSGAIAVTAACTHQGCILQQNTAAGRLDCPCHRTAFAVDGRLLFSQLASEPAPLPRLRVRTQGGNVEVLVPPPV
jgi:Rieske Fe-S protein